jgi:hypothetical protein
MNEELALRPQFANALINYLVMSAIDRSIPMSVLGP